MSATQQRKCSWEAAWRERNGHQGDVTIMEEDVVKGRQRGEKGMETRGMSQWWRRTLSKAEKYQTVCQSHTGGQGGEGVRVRGGTRRHRCWCPWRGRCEGARGHEETQVLVAMEGKV